MECFSTLGPQPHLGSPIIQMESPEMSSHCFTGGIITGMESYPVFRTYDTVTLWCYCCFNSDVLKKDLVWTAPQSLVSIVSSACLTLVMWQQSQHKSKPLLNLHSLIINKITMKPSDWLGDVYCWENELLILCICFKPLIKGTKKRTNNWYTCLKPSHIKLQPGCKVKHFTLICSLKKNARLIFFMWSCCFSFFLIVHIFRQEIALSNCLRGKSSSVKFISTWGQSKLNLHDKRTLPLIYYLSLTNIRG